MKAGNLSVGNLIRLHSFDHRPEQGASFTYKAEKGKRFVAVLLGVEPVDGKPLDTTAALQSLGWTPPPHGKREEEGAAAPGRSAEEHSDG